VISAEGAGNQEERATKTDWELAQSTGCPYDVNIPVCNPPVPHKERLTPAQILQYTQVVDHSHNIRNYVSRPCHACEIQFSKFYGF